MSKNLRRVSLSLVLIDIILFSVSLYSRFQSPRPVTAISTLKTEGNDTRELVVASLNGDPVSWINENLPDWTARIYVVNNPDANLTVPLNKGRESMVYLTYAVVLIHS